MHKTENINHDTITKNNINKTQLTKITFKDTICRGLYF